MKAERSMDAIRRRLDRGKAERIIFAESEPSAMDLLSGAMYIDTVGLKAYAKDGVDGIYTWSITKV